MKIIDEREMKKNKTKQKNKQTNTEKNKGHRCYRESAKSRAWRSRVLGVLTCTRAYVLVCSRAWRVYVLTIVACFRAYVLDVLMCLVCLRV